MKQQLLLLTLFIACFVNGNAQAPAYYDDINLNQSGVNLMDELAIKIITTHDNFLSYTPEVWNVLKQSDINPNNPNEVLLVYGYNDNDGNPKTDRTRSKHDNGGSVGDWNREHVYAKSLGTPNLGTSGPGADAHHLRSCDLQMNSTRSNRRFADASGNARGLSSGRFYPGDEWKGDVARMIMYMYLRYGDRSLPKNVGYGTTVSSDSNMIGLFLEWNAEDPVSDFEINRNNVIAGYQGNRNPFIDNPAFATQIWGGPQAEDKFNGGNSGEGGNEGENPDPDAVVFISEYVEGSSYNKAIEIANFSGNAVDLSRYSLKKQTNGSGSWSGTAYNFSGTLANGLTYVVANNRASSTVKNKANTTTGSGVFSFNGNDAVGLFKDGVLIDIVGVFNSGVYFGKDKTLRRKPVINSPNTSYTVSEWDVYNKDSFNDLGMHSVNSLSVVYSYQDVGSFDDYKIYTDNSNALIINANNSEKVHYNIATIDGRVVSENIFSNKLKINNINSGIYIITLINNGDVFKKKIVKK